jgi:CRP-like cAMP-binding protein
MNYNKTLWDPRYSRIVEHVRSRVEMDDASMKKFLQFIEVKTFRRKSFFLQAGEVCQYQAYVNRGCLITYCQDIKSHPSVLQFAFEDWWVNDIASFFLGTPAHYSIEILEEAELFLFNRDHMEMMYHEVPQTERLFRLLLQRAMISLQDRIVWNMTLNAEERYMRLIKKYPDLEKRVAQHLIASYIGITPEALSRTRRAIIEKMRQH